MGELAEEMGRVVDFRDFLRAIAAFVASEDGAAVLPRAPRAGRLVLVVSVLVRDFLVAGPPVASTTAGRFRASMARATEAAFSVFFGFTRRTRSDFSGRVKIVSCFYMCASLVLYSS